ncbi:hypothetical protein QI633_09625 [Nocardioides sp. QY071]|uniref:hypothetical protein n=1 Tax=Nocardioides sp. QY071 TaxID=3044187 RepID=UPI00249A620B|nr:hypothetical protein [Nocardioides sp. QY071]WGY04012.1 hypothetical protein QI633_09625 [Nocardioides sp. QY071]
MGIRYFYNDEAHQHLDTARNLSEAEKRLIRQKIAQDDTRLSTIMESAYADTVSRSREYLDSIMRLRDSGLDNIDADIEAYQNGELSDDEFGERLTTYSAEINKLRPLAQQAQDAEEHAWAEVNVTPGAYQRQVAKRFPALFANGRGLLALPTADDD